MENQAEKSVKWEALLCSFLHDPPDKSLSVRDHEVRAARYLSVILGCDEATARERHRSTSVEDQHASAVERLPFPKGDREQTRIGADDQGRILIKHPMSGDEYFLSSCAVNEENVIAEIKRVMTNNGNSDAHHKFLAIWRLLPEAIACLNPAFLRLPADTRIPDHTIWNHLDITAGLHLPLQGSNGAAFLAFQIGPVQSFIAAARSVRDLWTGSAILSWLTFKAMLPIIENLGPTAIIFPALRGLPLMDVWLHNQRNLEDIPEPNASARLTPCVPNKFLAVVPHGDGKGESLNLAEYCKNAAREAWNMCCNAVRNELNKIFSTLSGGKDWGGRWEEQVSFFWDIHTAVLPWRECGENLKVLAELRGAGTFEEAFPEAAKVRGLADAIPDTDKPGYDQKQAGRWQALVDFSARLMDSQRSIRHVPPSTRIGSPTECFPPKCTMLGTYEQMGPDKLRDSAKFWEEASRKVSLNGVRLRQGERLCAIGLVKRFAAPAFLGHELNLEDGYIRCPDTPTIAAAKWLNKANLDPLTIRKEYHDWNGQWLHWPRPDFDKDDGSCPEEVWKLIAEKKRPVEHGGLGAPPSYYAILVMDGDEMGKWLSGLKSPAVGAVLHPKMRNYFEGLADKEKVMAGLGARRPVGPALHAAISEALTNFAVHAVPEIVRKHNGTLVYAGGDDVLALLPARDALPCALELRQAFRGEIDGNNGAPSGYWRYGKNSDHPNRERDYLVMGPKATISAGIAVAHWKENLRDALDAARQAEKMAKSKGRDALVLTICRRSGEHSSALCVWDMVRQIEEWITAFEQGASDRWVYHLQAELPSLSGNEIPMDAVVAEIKRQVNRAEAKTRELFRETQTKKAGDIIAEAFTNYVAARNKREKDGKSFPNDGMTSGVLEDFLTLIQSASFIARGRDL